MPKFFITSNKIENNNIIISGDDAKHIKKVLRYKEGKKLIVCDCVGNDYECIIKSFLDKEILLEITSIKKSLSEPKIKITLFQSLPKSDKMEMIIQKCVEIGVYNIVPINTERSIIKMDNKNKEIKKIERWKKISESASKQSGRGIIPNINNIIDFNEAIKLSKNFDYSIILYENETKNTLRGFINNFSGTNIALFIGSEGGFSNSEIDIAIANNIMPITLGKRILRTETAGICTLSILMYELDWGVI